METEQQAELRQLVVEATRALAHLEADRLEEMALCCEALNRDCSWSAIQDRAELVRQAQDAAGEMAVFARVLEATRANMNVLRRLQELRTEHLEYGRGVESIRLVTVRGHGND